MAKELLKPITILNAKPKEKDHRLNDGGGLYLLIKPNGAKWWRFDYSIEGKRKTLSLGVYPVTGLADARRKVEEARKQISNNIDPSNARKEKKAAQQRIDAGLPILNSFEHVAREWGSKKVDTWTEKNNHSKRMLERNIFPHLGSKSITDILPKDILTCLRLVEDRGTIDTAHRTLQICGQIFKYAVATGRLERDISADLKGALPVAKGSHFAAVTDPKQVGALLRAIDAYSGTFVVKSALQLAPLVFVRPGELRRAEWAHIDLDAREWRYLVTKTKIQHIVPLSTQAVDILTKLHCVTGQGRYVFPSIKTPNGSRPMSDMALSTALRCMGFDSTQMSVHGFRAMARTLLDEVLGFRPDWIEHQLSHSVRDPNGRAYNRTSHLPERHKMMEAWTGYLSSLKAGAAIISI